jgi:hypothetical protein
MKQVTVVFIYTTRLAGKDAIASKVVMAHPNVSIHHGHILRDKGIVYVFFGIEIVHGEINKFCTGLTGGWGSQVRTKTSCISMKSSTDQPRKNPFHLYSLSPHSPQFHQSAGATPLYSLSGLHSPLSRT